MAGRYPGVTRRGRGFQISFQYQGQRCRETLRLEDTAKGEREAFDFLSAVRREITLGIFDYSKTFPSSCRVESDPNNLGTIEQELDRWMRLHGTHLAKSTRIDYQRRINKHLIPSFGHIVLGKLTRSDVLEWVNKNSDLSPKSIRNTLGPLMVMYTEAIREGRLETSPLHKLRLPRLNTRQAKPFNEDEIEKILAELSGQVKNYFAFAFETGLRTSELIALQWDDIDEQQGRVWVRRAKVRGEIKEPKSRSGMRFVDLSNVALCILADQRDYSIDHECIFLNPKTGNPWHNSSCLREQHWYPALKRAAVVPREPYQTRHTFASLKLSRDNAPPIWLAAQMGHSDCGQIFTNYGRWVPKVDSL